MAVTTRSVVEVGNTAIRRNLCVDVATLLLVQVDLCLEDIDLLSCCFELRPVLILLLLKIALLLLIFVIIEDLLVSAVELPVESQLLRAKVLDHIK